MIAVQILRGVETVFNSENFKRAAKVYMWLVIALLIVSACSAIFAVIGLLNGWTIANWLLVLSLITLVYGFFLIGFAGEIFEWAILTAELAKGLVYNSQLQIGVSIWRAIGNVTNWTEDKIQEVAKLIAAMIPGVNLMEVQNAFNNESAQPQPELDPIFKAAEVALAKIAEKARRYTKTIKSVFLTAIAVLNLTFISNLLLRFGNQPDTDHFLNKPANIFFCLFLLTTLIYGVINKPLMVSGFIKVFRGTWIVLFAIMLWQTAGYYFGTDCQSKQFAGKIKAINTLGSVRTDYEKKIILDRVSIPEVIAVGNHYALLIKGDSITVSNSTIPNGSVWRQENDSVMVGRERYIKVYPGYGPNGYGPNRKYVYADPNWFVPNKNTNGQQTYSSDMLFPIDTTVVYDCSEGVKKIMDVNAGTKIVLTPQLLSDKISWNYCTCAKCQKLRNNGIKVGENNDLSGIKKKAGDTDEPGDYPARWLNIGCLIVKVPGFDWQALDHKISFTAREAGPILVCINDRLQHLSDNRGSVQIQIHTS